jgi:hypothetical protein
MGIVGSPSSSKSPAMGSVFDPVRYAEDRLAAGYDDDLRTHEMAKELAEAKRARWRKEVQQAVDKGGFAPPLPLDAIAPELPVRVRIWAADVTTEKAAVLAAGLPRGILMIRDELAGWLGSFDRYAGGGSDRPFALEMYGGRPYTVDRIKSQEPLHMPNLSIGILGAFNLPPEERTRAVNAMLAVIAGVRPRNETDGVLAAQMAATHQLAMTLLERTRQAQHIPVLESHGNMAVKLMRTFTAQTEALAKLRRGGNQMVRVEHVHVHAGGQAIVGNIAHTGGRGRANKVMINPMQPERIMTKPDVSRLNQSPRCGAKTRSGSRCQSPAVTGRRRCRMHGGAKGSGAPKGQANGNYRHGGLTCEAIHERRSILDFIRRAKGALA